MALPSGKVSTSSGVPLSAAYCFHKTAELRPHVGVVFHDGDPHGRSPLRRIPGNAKTTNSLLFSYYKESGHKIKRPVPLRGRGIFTQRSLRKGPLKTY